MSETPEYRSIALYYRNMEDFLPAMKFDRWDNYQWLGDYDPKPSWGNLWRSGQYVGFPASAYATFASELAGFVGNEYDEEDGRFASNKPMLGKSCPSQDAIDTWFVAKLAANEALVLELQAVENWHETYKRKVQKIGKDIKKNRESFLAEQAESAGFDKDFLQKCDSYRAAIAISKPATMMAWKILLPKLTAERESMERTVAEGNAMRETEMENIEKERERTEEEKERTEEEREKLGEAVLELEKELEEQVERELQQQEEEEDMEKPVEADPEPEKDPVEELERELQQQQEEDDKEWTEAEREKPVEADPELERESVEEVEMALQQQREEEERQWLAELENEAEYMMAGLWKSDLPPASGGGNETLSDLGTN